MALAFEPQLHPPANFNPYGSSKGSLQGCESRWSTATPESARGTTTAHSSFPSQAGPSRMTYHWRRLGAVAVALLALYMAWLIALAIGGWLVTTAEASDSLESAPAMEHVVQPGDTLWSVAVSLDTDRDIRAVVADLREANGGVDLRPGQTLDLTPGYSR